MEFSEKFKPLVGITKGILYHAKCLEDGKEPEFVGEVEESLTKMKMRTRIISSIINESWEKAIKRKIYFEDSKIVLCSL